MAHNFTIVNIEHLTGTDIANVTGTVDGQRSAAVASWAQILAEPNASALQAYLGPLLLAGVIPSNPSTNTSTFNGSWVA